MDHQRREKGSSISRVLDLLKRVALAEGPLPLPTLLQTVDIPKASFHRLVQQLVSEEYLQLDPSGDLVPGVELRRMALGVLGGSEARAERQAILEKLAQRTGETCGISIPDGLEMHYFDRVQTNWPLQIHLPVGTRTPIWATSSGKLYLALLPAAKRAAIVKRLALEPLTRKTITDPVRLEEELTALRSQGIGVDDEEFIDGMVAVAVPIRSPAGKVAACLFTHAPVMRKSLEELRGFLPDMRAAAQELETLLAR